MPSWGVGIWGCGLCDTDLGNFRIETTLFPNYSLLPFAQIAFFLQRSANPVLPSSAMWVGSFLRSSSNCRRFNWITSSAPPSGELFSTNFPLSATNFLRHLSALFFMTIDWIWNKSDNKSISALLSVSPFPGFKSAATREAFSKRILIDSALVSFIRKPIAGWMGSTRQLSALYPDMKYGDFWIWGDPGWDSNRLVTQWSLSKSVTNFDHMATHLIG